MQLAERIRHVEQALSDPQRALARIKISTAWRDAAWVFALSRLVIFLMTYIGTGIFPLASTLQPQSKLSRLHGWYHYDAIAYAVVAHQGYQRSPLYGFLSLLAPAHPYPGDTVRGAPLTPIILSGSSWRISSSSSHWYSSIN